MVNFDTRFTDYFSFRSPALSRHMGGAADFKVGVQNRIRERSERKNCTPTFPNVGYKQANISRGLLNILKFAVWLSH